MAVAIATVASGHPTSVLHHSSIMSALRNHHEFVSHKYTTYTASVVQKSNLPYQNYHAAILIKNMVGN
jgi:hypothetical protein